MADILHRIQINSSPDKIYQAILTASGLSKWWTKEVRTTSQVGSIAEDYNLELQYRKPFIEVWKEEKNDPTLGPLSERMGVRERGGGALLITDEEMDAASKLYP